MAAGISTMIPAGWHQVRLRRLPGAEVPLEIASYKVRRVVDDICKPRHGILNHMPKGGAIVQLLDDTRGFRHRPSARSEFPPLRKPFRLGRPEGHECAEAYNVFFRHGGRALQLRVWSPLPEGPSAMVRRQVEAIVDRLEVRPRRSASKSDGPKRARRATGNSHAYVRGVHYQARTGGERERILRLHGLTLLGTCRHVDGNPKPLLSIVARTSVDDAIFASHFDQQGHGSPTYTFVLDDFDRSDGPRDVLGTNPDATAGTLNYSRPDGGQVSVSFVADEQPAQGMCVFGGTATAAP